MIIMAVDLGQARTGIAVCDKGELLASPVCVIEEYNNSSLLKVQLFTGKTHQIRAHLAHIGHQIIGDGKYGLNSVNKEYKEKRQRLTAYEVHFTFDKNSPLSLLNGESIKLDRKPF